MDCLNINKDWDMDRKIWHFINNTNEIPKCSICNIEDCRWQYYKNSYGFCSRSCAGSQSLKTRANDTGVSNPFQLESIKKKSKNTLLITYNKEKMRDNKIDYLLSDESLIKEKRVKIIS